MKKIWLAIHILLIAPLFSIAQKEIEIKSFDERLELAKWMTDYNEITDITGDSLPKTLRTGQDKAGFEKFCYRDTDAATWHAIYGSLENGAYHINVNFTANVYGKVSRGSDAPDTLFLNSFARALINGHKLVPDSFGIPFHQFIMQNQDKTLSVWLMPAYNYNSHLVPYGCDFYGRFDATGNNLLEKQANIQPLLRSFPLTNEMAKAKQHDITLDYRNMDDPPIGGIYFAWRYKGYFRTISIVTKKSTSLLQRGNVYNFWWTHYERNDE